MFFRLVDLYFHLPIFVREKAISVQQLTPLDRQVLQWLHGRHLGSDSDFDKGSRGGWRARRPINARSPSNLGTRFAQIDLTMTAKKPKKEARKLTARSPPTNITAMEMALPARDDYEYLSPALALPPGVYFNPTKEEIVRTYLNGWIDLGARSLATSDPKLVRWKQNLRKHYPKGISTADRQNGHLVRPRTGDQSADTGEQASHPSYLHTF